MPDPGDATLRKAFEKHEFSVVYQPQVDCTTNEVVGLEALVRWYNPELGWIPPADFIPIAEDTGLVVPLDRWALILAPGNWSRRAFMLGRYRKVPREPERTAAKIPAAGWKPRGAGQARSI